ncbi:hypothetical protein [Desertibacillus haloalkaliphilus]|uniref:hypothetical protein n=1 Tax=Desertibacillus haloalkaliphilus TaxID=1328930 RepID=UPI001C258DE4|nr:hypothetical protein [Desertibacillus haloalkaliphilus]MBU8905804.1 hypothetical protein [Desertibacillus haloalkaliphilus]
MKNGKTGIQRGQAITFRLPSDTPDHIIRQLQTLKETERRNFSSKIAEFVLEGVNDSLAKERETVTIPLPQKLNKEQRNWLRHAHSEALLGSIVYQLLADPVRATSVLASLNSNALDIDEALYLQESERTMFDDDISHEEVDLDRERLAVDESAAAEDTADFEDELENFDLDQAKQEQGTVNNDEEEAEDEEEDVDDLLGGFLAEMNK